MANHIDDATIEYVGILAKLELSGEEKEQAKKEDVVTNGDGSEDTLKNAPEAQDNAFVVPKTII